MSTSSKAYDLSKISLLPNPDPAIASHFIDPPTLAPTTQGVGIALAIVTTLFVAIRLHSNAHAAHKLGLDDGTPTSLHLLVEYRSDRAPSFCVMGILFTHAYTALAITCMSRLLARDALLHGSKYDWK